MSEIEVFFLFYFLNFVITYHLILQEEKKKPLEKERDLAKIKAKQRMLGTIR